MKLTSLGSGVGHLKAGFLGWQGSGKTFTAVDLAIGTAKHLKLSGPIAMLDTEGGGQFLAEKVKKETGKDLVGVQSRALSDAIEFIGECERGGISVAIIDSASHLWIEWMESYLKQINDARAKAGKSSRKLEFQDWGAIKRKWAELTTAYLNSKLHIIVCGRAGDLYANEINDESGKREIVKTGIKMVAEGQFGYEPSLLIEMEQLQEKHGLDARKIVRRATVLKDRFGVLDGKSCDNPTFEFFKPYIERLTPGAHVAVDATKSTSAGEIDEDGNADWQREKRNRQIYSEEIQGLLVEYRPGRSDQDKLDKQQILFEALGTRSWTAVENMPSDRLKEGLDKIRLLASKAVKAHEKAVEEIKEKFGVPVEEKIETKKVQKDQKVKA